LNLLLVVYDVPAEKMVLPALRKQDVEPGKSSLKVKSRKAGFYGGGFTVIPGCIFLGFFEIMKAGKIGI
jgi:hypothetical protein